MNATIKIGDIWFSDIEHLLNKVGSLPSEKRLTALYREFDLEISKVDGVFCSQRLAVCGIGGIPFSIDPFGQVWFMDQVVNPIKAMQETRRLAASSAHLSYLTTDTVQNTLAKLKKLGHYSIFHAAQLNLFLVGITLACEAELNCQRDIVHLSRITIANTKAQSAPPIVVRCPDQVETFGNILKRVNELQGNLSSGNLEVSNLLFPAAKGTALMISGTLSNLRKLSELADDVGKEEEFREVCLRIRRVVEVVLSPDDVESD